VGMSVQFSAAPPVKRPMVLCVDLDGTLINTDSLHEAVLLVLKHNPFAIFRLLKWMFSGKAAFKEKVTRLVTLNVASLPYRKEILDSIHEKRCDGGQEVYLVTGADRRLADAVSEHLQLFEGVLASDGVTNLTGLAKAGVLRSRFGEK